MKIQNKIFGVFMSIVIVVLFFIIFLGEKSFLKHTKYTIATITSDFHYKQTLKGAGTDLIYYINNKKYERTESRGTFIKGERYLVAYDSVDPNSGKLLEIRIFDSIDYPKNGWKLKDIPFKVDTTAIKNELKKW